MLFFQNSKSVNELICLDDSTTSSTVDFGGITLDNFTLDDLNDDEFNPRAVEQPSAPSPFVQVGSVTTTTPTSAPVLVPPPALPPREFKKISPVPENNNNPFRYYEAVFVKIDSLIIFLFLVKKEFIF